MIGVGLYEFYRLLDRGAIPHWKWLGIGCGWSVLGWLGVQQGEQLGFFFSLLLLLHFLVALGQHEPQKGPIVSSLVATLSGELYVGFLLSHVYLIYTLHQGKRYLLYLLLTVWLGDSMALGIGKRWGRTPLAVHISPHKTIAGAIGGWGGSVLGAVIAKLSFLPTLTMVDSLLTGTLLALLGQLGDLAESLLKRSVGAKDSGDLIPGHGGLLDRIDGLFFAAPAWYYYLLYIVERRS